MSSQKILLILALVSGFHEVTASEYFIHPNGGDIEHCTGLSQQPYSEGIEDKACALKHLFELLGPEHETININGGDIITILNNDDGSQAEYRMGYHDDYTANKCHLGWAYSCNLPSIPAGTAENPTIIRGEDWESGCETPPQLWGSNRASNIIRLIDTQNVELSCLEITDHSSCIGVSGLPDESLICDRSEPYTKLFADVGIYMEGSSDIKLTDVTVKGLSRGIMAGRVSDVTLLRTHLYANYGAGWDGDIYGDDDSVSGDIKFIDSSITFSGCALIYNPGEEDHNQPHACARQDIGGYGDGIGTGKTGGNWIFENTQVLYNSSDGIDLLYHELEGKITIKNSRIEGNAGNQVKVAGNAELINNIIISNCGWNARQAYKLGGEGSICRAGGAPLSISWAFADDKAVLINNTVLSEGDCIMGAGPRTEVAPSNQSFYAVNNVFYGLTDYRQDWENSCLLYTESHYPNRQIHNNIIHQVKSFDDPCNDFNSNIPSGDNANEGLCHIASGGVFDDRDYTIPTNPYFERIELGINHTAYDIETLKQETNKPYPADEKSPVINMGYAGTVAGIAMPTKDFLGNDRIGNPDIGAVEFKANKLSTIPKAPKILTVEQL